MQGFFSSIEMIVEVTNVPFESFHSAAEGQQVTSRVPKDSANMGHHLYLLLQDTPDSSENLPKQIRIVNIQRDKVCVLETLKSHP